MPGSLEQGLGLPVWLEQCLAHSRNSVHGGNKSCPLKPASVSPIMSYVLPERPQCQQVEGLQIRKIFKFPVYLGLRLQTQTENTLKN